jgi:hypothetical protein
MKASADVAATGRGSRKASTDSAATGGGSGTASTHVAATEPEIVIPEGITIQRRARKASRSETDEMLTPIMNLDASISDGRSTYEDTNESAEEKTSKRKRGRSKMATVRWEEDSFNKYENSDFPLEPMDEPTKVPIQKSEARQTKSNLATEEQMTAMFKDLRSQIEALTARQKEIKVAPAEIKVAPGPSQLHYKKPMLPKFDGSQDLNIWLLNLERLFTSHTKPLHGTWKEMPYLQ